MTLLCWVVPVALADDVTGYVEVRADYGHGLEGERWGLHERLRPTVELAPHERVRVVSTFQVVLDQGRHPEQEAVDLLEAQLPTVVTNTCPLPDPGEPIDEVSDFLSLERLFVDVYGERADLRVGRQALNWGSAILLNPTDLFAETLLTTPWQERQGVDAARATVPLGDRHQVMAVAAVSRWDDDGLEGLEGRFGLRPTLNVAGTDLSPVASATTEGEYFLGLDAKGQLVVGWWLEGGVHLAPLLDGEAPQLEASVGVDWSVVVLDGLVLAAQYTYDGTGLADPDDYSPTARGSTLPTPDCAYAEQEEPDGAPRFTIGRHYALASARLSLFDDYQLAATGLMNLQDRSAVLVPSLSWKPGGIWSLDLLGQFFLGEGELNPHDTPAMSTVVIQPDPDQDVTRIYVDTAGLVPAWSLVAYVRAAF